MDAIQVMQKFQGIFLSVRQHNKSVIHIPVPVSWLPGNYDINRALYPKYKSPLQQVELTSIAMLPHQQSVTKNISRLLAKHNTRTIHMLRSAKNELALKVPGIYCIPCKCCIYTGWTGRIIKTRYKEHIWHTHLHHPEKPEVVEHSTEAGYRFNLKSISILRKVMGYMDHNMKEETEIQLHPNHFNRQIGFTLSQCYSDQHALTVQWNANGKSKHLTLPSHEYWFQAGTHREGSRYPVTPDPWIWG
jgi:hypothetical protein